MYQKIYSQEVNLSPVKNHCFRRSSIATHITCYSFNARVLFKILHFSQLVQIITLNKIVSKLTYTSDYFNAILK